ncbi:MAG: zinc-dependent alcohol dehydrogenase family protein [Rhodospirillaceae bacterium]
MRVARYTRNGDPSTVIEIVEEETPAPQAGEVTIRMEAAPIHLADLYCMSGKERFEMPLPAVPGFEGIGHIIAVGEGVTSWAVGDRVFPPIACGAWRDEITVSATDLLPAPAGDAAQLSLMPINPPTSYLILEDFGGLKSGDWVIQNAANSNCGRYLIELAKLRGIKTINVVRRPELIDELKALGGDIVLVDSDDLSERVLKATGGVPAKLAVDAVNGMATARLAECLADGSTVLAYGVLTDEPCMLPSDVAFLRDIRLIGFYTVRQFAKRSPEAVKAIYTELAQLFEDGTLTAKIAATYSLDDVKEAVTHAGRRGAERDGKVILTMA